MNFDGVSTKELRAEVARRDEEERKKAWDDFNERFGPCAECGGRLVGGESKVVREHRTAVPSWPMDLPPPPGYGQIVGADWEITWICERGHRVVTSETQFYDKPIKEMFA